jgi:transformation/transcription domain-associated protein
MLHALRHENDENGITASKMLMDIVRGHRSLTEESIAEFVVIFQEAFAGMQGLVNQYLSEDSLPLDANISLPALHSFKVLAEMTMVMVLISQIHKNLVPTMFQGTTVLAFEVLALESSVQHKARTEYEAMGGFWAGISPTIRNPGLYSDFIYAQIKAGDLQGIFFGYLTSIDLDATISYLRYSAIWRNIRNLRGDTCSECSEVISRLPIEWCSSKKGDSWLMIILLLFYPRFRHLMSTPHRRALFDQLDKLFDEKVLLGTGLASRENLR